MSNEASELYDIAISFLVKDESIAHEFYKNLSPYMKVFFFPHTQEDLAGTDGMESMRLPFLRTKLTLVLHSDGWGETPWTRVEATAIKENCLERGWDHLFFVALKQSANLPVWLPKTHVRLNYSDYGMKQAVGAVKSRLEALGGKLVRPNAQSIAKAAKMEIQHEANRQSKFNDQNWIFSAVHPSVNKILEIVAYKMQVIKSQDDLEVSDRLIANKNWGPASYVANYNNHGLSINWTQKILNNLSEAKLEAKIWNGELALPGYYHPYNSPQSVKTINFKADLGRDGNVMWEHISVAELLSEESVAEEILREFFNTMIERINKSLSPSIHFL